MNAVDGEKYKLIDYTVYTYPCDVQFAGFETIF